MALKLGQIARTTHGGINSPYLTPEHNEFAATVYPSEAISLRMTLQGGLTTHWPVEANGRQITGQLARAFHYDWYFRIHITPQSLDLGSVVSTQTSPVVLWNAYLVPRTLESITGQVEGLSVSGQPNPPLLMLALAEKTWQIAVTPDGSPTLDQIVGWVFDNGDIAKLRITATRVVAWAWRAEWSDGVLERLEWMTTVSASQLGREQRRKMRIAPRRTFKLKSIAEGKARRFMELSLADAGGRNWAIPVWPHTQFTKQVTVAGTLLISCSTQYRDFEVGGLVMISTNNAWENEVLEIKSIALNSLELVRPTGREWPIGSRLSPAKIARFMEQPVAHRLRDDAVSVELHFMQMENADWLPSIPSPMYLGRPVVLERPEESEDLTSSYVRLLKMVDNRTSLPVYTDTAGIGFSAHAHRWFLNGLKKQSDFRSLMYHLSGQFKSVWVPTHYSDLTLVADIPLNSVFMDVEWCGYTKTGGSGYPGKRDVQILLKNGQYLFARISGSNELSSDVERLVIEIAFPGALLKSSVQRISFMAPMRLDQDFIELNHETDSEGLATSKAVWRTIRDDL